MIKIDSKNKNDKMALVAVRVSDNDMVCINTVKSKMGIATSSEALRFAIRRVSDELQNGSIRILTKSEKSDE